MRITGVVLTLIIIMSPLILLGNSATSQSWSPAEQELWNLEKTYMTLLNENNVQKLAEFWHQDFIGWPSHSSKPLNRDEGIVSLETLLENITSSSFTFHPKAIQILGNTAVVHYRVEFDLQTKDGERKKNSYRVTHTWMKDSDDWRILGGMSSK